MKRLAVLLVATACVPAGGCGTFSDTLCGPLSGPRYYRGVWFDCLAVREGNVYMLPDIPLSFVADTVVALVRIPGTIAEAVRPPDGPGPSDAP